MRIGAGGVRTGVASQVQRNRCPPAALRGPRHPESGVLVLDVVYILGIIAVFVLVGLIAKGVEKL